MASRARHQFNRRVSLGSRRGKGAAQSPWRDRNHRLDARTDVGAQHRILFSQQRRALRALTHALAISLAPDVRVNCVSPGWIETKDYSALRRKDHEQHPAGRVGRPEDVDELASWRLDGKRSGFVTGANFVIDGGMTRKMIYEE